MNDKHLSCVLLVNQSTGYLMIDIVNAYAEKYSIFAIIEVDIVANFKTFTNLITEISNIINT